MRVYDSSFLSIYSWTRDIHSKCRVVQRADWCELEAELITDDCPRVSTRGFKKGFERCEFPETALCNYANDEAFSAL